MDTPEIISAILAILTFIGIMIALGLGVYSIRESRVWQKRAYQDKWLDIIIDWTLDVTKPNLLAMMESPQFEEITKDLEGMKRYESMINGHWGIASVAQQHRGIFISKLVGGFDSDLEKAIKELIEVLEKEIDLHDKYRLAFLDIQNIIDFNSLLKQWIKEIDPLTSSRGKCAQKVIKEATRIKSRDLI